MIVNLGRADEEEAFQLLKRAHKADGLAKTFSEGKVRRLLDDSFSNPKVLVLVNKDVTAILIWMLIPSTFSYKCNIHEIVFYSESAGSGFRLLKESSMDIKRCPVSPEDLSQLVNLVSQGRLTDQIGKAVLDEMFKKGKKPEEIIKEKKIEVLHERSILEQIVREVIEQNPDTVRSIKAGKEKAINFLLGQVMKKTKGKADPKIARELILKNL